jgi:hypothetical protein
VIGAVLTQDEGGEEFIVAYVSRRLTPKRGMLTDKNLGLSLYYACTKFLHYILSSTCIIVCHHDVVKYMLHKPYIKRENWEVDILIGRIRFDT